VASGAGKEKMAKAQKLPESRGQSEHSVLFNTLCPQQATSMRKGEETGTKKVAVLARR